ncbi:MAG: MarR family transcriptional regulator, partial [Erysipelotrichaceae bacterium]|nr:MarR family transcriptional regulator [Erysipelotrichaceae bacterium]
YNGGYLIGQINKLTNRRINELLKEENVREFNGAQGTIIFVLTNEGPMPIKDIGKATGLAKTSLTSMLDRMEKQGLIEKRENENDKRSTIIALNERAKSYKEVIEKVSQRVSKEYYKGLRAKEVERFEATLQKVLKNLNE